MIQDKLKGHQAAIAQLYEAFIGSLSDATMLATFEGADPYVSRKRLHSRIEDVIQQSYKLLSREIDESIGLIVRETSKIAFSHSLINEDTPLRIEHTEAFQGESRNQLHGQILSQMHRDAGAVKREFQRALVTAISIGRNDDLSLQNAWVRYRERASSDLFSHRDRAGRRWSSTAFVRTEIAATWLNIWNTTMMADMYAAGHDRGKIHRPGSSSHGTEFSLDDYESIESREFHPNSWALVVPITLNL